ncbi:MAG TPA: hypothetical protein VGD69_04885 [Herpetosiphonaceae bacterium]
MDTRRIVTRLTSQAMEIGCLTGGALGALYGVLLPVGFVLVMLFYSGSTESIDAAVIFGLYGGTIGLFIGGIVGVLAGLALGLINGLAVAMLTIVRYTPIADPHAYRWSVRLVSISITLLGILLVLLVLGRVPHKSSEFYFVGIPLLLTPPSAWSSGGRLADWYLTQLGKTVEPAPA